jgi:hypothetical protein
MIYVANLLIAMQVDLRIIKFLQILLKGFTSLAVLAFCRVACTKILLNELQLNG